MLMAFELIIFYHEKESVLQNQNEIIYNVKFK